MGLLITNQDLIDLVAKVAELELRVARLEGKRQDTTGDFKLCYVRHGQAWFTTNSLSKQWGDDWNDAPYEHNAGDPYGWSLWDWEKRGIPEFKLVSIRYEGLETPADLAYGGNSGYSVDSINLGRVAWLSNSEGINIYAGASIQEFKQKVRAAGGTVFQEDVDL